SGAGLLGNVEKQVQFLGEPVQAGFIHLRKINGGVLINNSLRVQLHKHYLNPIKGRGYSGSINAAHLNVNKFHLIFNPRKWDALSTWRYTPFRF
ncbi:hypothetical protein, partial [Phaeodactylibacter luteus]|uniref:hypothetical protein n=1 Tax=Phaeodactylibacter luteus TaxID=1564516 RepID=UPI001B872286